MYSLFEVIASVQSSIVIYPSFVWQVTPITTPTLVKPDPVELHLVEDSDDDDKDNEGRSWKRWDENVWFGYQCLSFESSWSQYNW